MNLTPKTEEIKPKTNEWDNNKPERFSTAKEIINKTKSHPTMGEYNCK